MGDRCADCDAPWRDGHWCDTAPGEALESFRPGVGYVRPLRPLVRVFFAWYDLWVGAFWKRRSRVLYVCPLPCLVVRLDFRRRHLPCRCGSMTAGGHFDWCQLRPEGGE